MTSLPRLLLIPRVQYGLEDYRAPPSSWKLSFPLRLITTPSLAPRARYLHFQPPDLALPQQQQVVGPKFMDIDRAWTTQTAPKTGNHEADVPALAGSRREETRALQKEAGQEVSGCSAGEVGGLLPFPQSSNQTGARQSNS